ncbi:hypothetical protein D9M71_87370 [compost metagenome]
MAVEVQHFAFEAGEGNDVQFTQIHAALFVVVRFFAQGRRQSQQELVGGDASWLGLAAHQLAQGKRAASALQFVAPFIVEAPALVEHEEHLETGIAKQHIRRLPGGGELIGAIGNVQALQQALADPTLTLPLAGIGQERVGLLGRDGQQA